MLCTCSVLARRVQGYPPFALPLSRFVCAWVNLHASRRAIGVNATSLLSALDPKPSFLAEPSDIFAVAKPGAREQTTDTAQQSLLQCQSSVYPNNCGGEQNADNMTYSSKRCSSQPVDGQSCTRPILAVRFAHSSISKRCSKLGPKSLPQIQHLQRSTTVSKKFARRISSNQVRQLQTIQPIQLRRVQPTFRPSIWRANTSTINHIVQAVWLKQQVRPCPCKMVTIIIIITLQT